MGIIALIVSIVGAVVALLSFVPSLGFFMWIGGILALAGLVLGLIGAQGEQKSVATVGWIVGAVFVIFAVLRIVGLF
jgi:hypothetical protein